MSKKTNAGYIEEFRLEAVKPIVEEGAALSETGLCCKLLGCSRKPLIPIFQTA